MNKIVINGGEFDNGYYLFKKGKTRVDMLPKPDRTEALINQGLADYDEESKEISLSARGMEYFKVFEKEKEHTRKDWVATNMVIDAKRDAAGKIRENPAEAVNAQTQPDPAQAQQAAQSEGDDIPEPVGGEAPPEEGADEEPVEASEGEAGAAAPTPIQESDRAEFARVVRIGHMDVRNVATESIGNVIIDSIDGVMNGFNSFMNVLKPAQKPMLLGFFESSLTQKANSVPYANLSGLMIPVPAGLQVKYSTLQEALENAVKRALTVEKKLDEFISLVANILTNSTARTSYDSKGTYFRMMQDERDASYSTIAACFSGSSKAKMKYGQVVDRNADWDQIIERARQMAKDIEGVKREVLLKKSRHLHSLLTKIKESANRGGFDIVSPEVVKSLIEGAHQIAYELEYYAVVYYRVNVHVNVLKQDEEAIKKAVNYKENAKDK